jgi:cell division protein FtsL
MMERGDFMDQNKNEYQYGTTVMAPLWDPQLDTPRKKKLSNQTRKNREKATYMNFAYVCFLTIALLLAATVLISYVQMKADLTNYSSDISKLKAELNNLRMANEEAYNRIQNSIDLEEIKRIAIGKLGMTFPEEGQVVTYDNTGSDYFRAADNGN